MCASSPPLLPAPSARAVLRMGYLEKRATSADAIESVGNKSLANKWNERLFILQADSMMYLSKPELITTPVKSHLSAVDTFVAKGSSCSTKHVSITAETVVSVLEIAEEWGDKEYVFEVSTSHETGGGGPFRFILCAEDEWTMRAWIAAITACAFAKRQSSIAGAKVSPNRTLHPAGIAQMKDCMNEALPDCDGELTRVSARLEHLASGATAADAALKHEGGAAAAMATPPTIRRLSSHEASRRFTELVDKFKDPSVNLSLSSMWAHALPGSKHAVAFTPKRAVELLHANRACPLRFTVFADCLLRLALEDREFREHTETFDFYLPQILHLADLPHATQRLEDVVVALAAMSIKLALRIVWCLWGNHEDAMKVRTVACFACCCCSVCNLFRVLTLFFPGPWFFLSSVARSTSRTSRRGRRRIARCPILASFTHRTSGSEGGAQRCDRTTGRTTSHARSAYSSACEMSSAATTPERRAQRTRRCRKILCTRTSPSRWATSRRFRRSRTRPQTLLTTRTMSTWTTASLRRGLSRTQTAQDVLRSG